MAMTHLRHSCSLHPGDVGYNLKQYSLIELNFIASNASFPRDPLQLRLTNSSAEKTLRRSLTAKFPTEQLSDLIFIASSKKISPPPPPVWLR